MRRCFPRPDGNNVSDAMATLTVYHDPSDRLFCDEFEGLACGSFSPTTGK